MLEVRLDAASLLGGFRGDQATVAFDVVECLDDSAPIQVKLLGGIIRVPAIRVHIGNELAGGLAATLQNQLAAPRMGNAHQKVIRRVGPQGTGDVGESVGRLRIVGAVQAQHLAGADRIDDALPKAEQVSASLALILGAECLAKEVDRLLVTRTQLDLPTAPERFARHGSDYTPLGAVDQANVESRADPTRLAIANALPRTNPGPRWPTTTRAAALTLRSASGHDANL